MKVQLPNLKISKDELTEDLQRVSEILNTQSIKKSDYEMHGKYSHTSFRNHFGSWRAALANSGLERSRNWGSKPDELLENIRDVWLKLGRQPKITDMTIPLSKFSSSTYGYKFGSWTQALTSFQHFLDQVSENEVPCTESSMAHSPTSRRTKRAPGWRLRFKTLQRDQFQCVSCGASPAKEAGVDLHVDHIKPWSKGGETEINNLQTLCRQCNLGKGNLEDDT